MAALDVGLVVTFVEHVWDVSVVFVPALFILFFVFYMTQREVPSFPSLAISSQRDMALHYSTYVLTGAVVGGIVAMLLPGSGVMLGALVAVLPVLYGLLREELPEPTVLQLDGVMDAVHLVWVGVPVLAAAAIVSGQILLQSVVALVFYATIFWEL